MGCCASKCKVKKQNFAAAAEEFCHVQDKLVVSQQQPPISRTPPIFHYHHHHSSNRISPIYPLSPTASSLTSDSLPSFSRRRGGGSLNSTASTTTTGSSNSSCSSLLTSKDRSFSNEFLWSCLKENPHVLYLNSIKESAMNLSESPVPKQGKKQSVHGNSITTPQKRVRSSSPVPPLTRQKSFRRDHPEVLSGSRRLIRSPSPSRRFGNADYLDRGIQTITTGNEFCSKRMVGNCKVNAARSISPYVKREDLKPAAPAAPASPCLKRNRETFIHRITSKIDELAVAEAMARHEGESDAMEEDIDNPLISLDCFIFL